MGRRHVRVVVGEGGESRALSATLLGQGFDVVGTAGDADDLQRLVTTQRPDVVVLDDVIGVGAVGSVREAVPNTKVVLVWPGAVVPIGGDARVEPGNVDRDLASTVERVAGPKSFTQTFTRPDWVERVRKDPGTLREMLSRSGGLPARSSVTHLQRRGRPISPAA